MVQTMLKLTKCPKCASVRIKLVTRDVVREFEGRKYKVKRVAFHECPACDERVYGPESLRKMEAALPAFEKVSK